MPVWQKQKRGVPMKNHKNHGFTLIEMLMVVAVIAVLVSIIVPRVSNATDKSAAAADAANLRAAKSAIASGIMEGLYGSNEAAISAEDLDVPVTSNYKEAGAFSAKIEDGVITVLYGEMDIDDLADIADNGKADLSNAGSATIAPEGK
jgi:prepilin-type N-terminal cleavage/methylation domain-containing protein